jgi:ADP-ribose pyrophosphatase YjhB (NUDIX family)
VDREELSRILGNVYGQGEEEVWRLIEKYQEYYDLPPIAKEQDVPSRLFRHYRRGVNFVVLAIANEANEVLVVKDSNSGGQHVWRLAGGYVLDKERIEDAYIRITAAETGLNIDEVEPLAVVINEFHCGNRTIRHRGIAFLIHTRGSFGLTPRHAGDFVAEPPDQMAYSNKEVLELAFASLHSRRTFAPHDEIDSSQGRTLQRFIHRNIINKPFKGLSSMQLKRKITQYCEGAETVLDAACGDDTLILDLARNARFCVANDISLRMLGHLRTKDAPSSLIFTTHNVTELPFKKKFDVAVFKNTLHHMHNLDEFLLALDSLRKVAHRLILVDIENPARSTRRAKFWHSYYVRFLGDRGGYFLTEEEFRESLSYVFSDATIRFDSVSTVKGRYLFAIVDFTSPPDLVPREEVNRTVDGKPSAEDAASMAS